MGLKEIENLNLFDLLSIFPRGGGGLLPNSVSVQMNFSHKVEEKVLVSSPKFYFFVRETKLSQIICVRSKPYSVL